MRNKGAAWAMMAVLAGLAGCCSKGTIPATGGAFDGEVDGKEVKLFVLSNEKGAQARITNYGGIVVSLKVPDKDGKLGDVVLGYGSLREYREANPYFGCIVGRYGNRIGNARFTLNGTEYALAANNGSNNLHGGVRGFDKVVWTAKEKRDAAGASLVLKYVSADGEEGFPGRLDCTVTYTLTDANEFRIDYAATTDAPTIVNLTQHSYFNLEGAGSGDVLDHVATINADFFTPVDKNLIPTGELRPVKGTPFDFTKPRKIGEFIEEDDEQIAFGKGYDHNWVLRSQDGSLGLAASVEAPLAGRVMEVWTTEPGIQFYTGNFLDGTNVGKEGRPYGHRFGFCLETQHYPDSPNRPEFPSVALEPGRTYHTSTVYKFLVR